MRKQKISSPVVCLAALFLIFPFAAKAYLDAGSGSYLVQVVVAAFVGGAFAVKMFFRQIKTFFYRLFHKQKKEGFNEKKPGK